jgi:uncharacterized protein GlcG (DUF336 family)
MNTEIALFTDKLIDKITSLLPEYNAIEADFCLNNGNVAICIIDENGNIYGKLYGNDKIRSRQSYKVAWIKASQVWITGIKTGEYEKLVFNNEIDGGKFGINMPDFIGWEGGQPIVLKNGTKLSVGFSGYQGTSDLEIVIRALKMIE